MSNRLSEIDFYIETSRGVKNHAATRICREGRGVVDTKLSEDEKLPECVLEGNNVYIHLLYKLQLT